MSNLPSEGQGGGSAFADFLLRVRPYPPPPGFWIAVLYAVGGAFGLLIAGVFAAALPTSETLRGDVAIGAEEVGAVLEWFRAPASAFVLAGLLGFGSAVAIASRRRLDNAAGGVLATLPMLGVVAAAWTGIGWLLVLVAYFITLVAWLIVFGLIGLAGFRLLIGDLGGAFVLLIIAFVVVSSLERATSDPPATGNVAQAQAGGSPSPPPAESEDSAPAPAAPDPALTRQRIALEARITSEYAAWKEVPFVGLCGREDRQLELGLLHEQFAAMKQQLRYAEREGQRGWFDRAVHNLEQVTEERERAMADPRWSYQQYERCPSGVGAMPYFW